MYDAGTLVVEGVFQGEKFQFAAVAAGSCPGKASALVETAYELLIPRWP